MLFAPLNAPLLAILPSASTAIAQTLLFAFGSKPASTAPFASSRAMLLRVTQRRAVQGSVVKQPPTENPAVSLHRDSTMPEPPVAFGSKESTRPVVASSRATLLRVSHRADAGENAAR